jgi:5'-nucleotidase/UDP-sugar diphosphatase
MAAEIAEESAKLDEKIGGIIGKTEIALVAGLDAGPDNIPIGDLLARLMLEETHSDVAFTNQGGVRAHIPKGDVRMKDILTALPFQNTIVTMDLAGGQLQALLDFNVSLGALSGGALHLAGVTYEVRDSSAVDVKVDGVPLDPTKTYRIATNNFLAAGGDGYEMLKQGANIYDTGTTVNSMLVGYIEKVGTITKSPDQK